MPEQETFLYLHSLLGSFVEGIGDDSWVDTPFKKIKALLEKCTTDHGHRRRAVPSNYILYNSAIQALFCPYCKLSTIKTRHCAYAASYNNFMFLQDELPSDLRL